MEICRASAPPPAAAKKTIDGREKACCFFSPLFSAIVTSNKCWKKLSKLFELRCDEISLHPVAVKHKKKGDGNKKSLTFCLHSCSVLAKKGEKQGKDQNAIQFMHLFS